jgi:hypothetical protein
VLGSMLATPRQESPSLPQCLLDAVTAGLVQPLCSSAGVKALGVLLGWDCVVLGSILAAP